LTSDISASDTFVTQQIFIRDFSEERAVLQYLADIVQSKKFLVSFNGKAFDVNLLATRYILNKFKNPLDGLPHLDLLFPSRRLCGHRLENSRLVTLEQALFGIYREDDMPGMEIPILTQHYVLLQRNLLYTGETRGKTLVVIVGSKRAMAIAVKNNKTEKRFTLLKQRLQR